MKKSIALHLIVCIYLLMTACGSGNVSADLPNNTSEAVETTADDLDDMAKESTSSSYEHDQLEQGSAKIIEEADIKGTYLEVDGDDNFYYQIVPKDKCSGTLIFHYDKVLKDKSYNYDNAFDDKGNTSFEYTYDNETSILSLSEEDSNWLHVMFGPKYFIVEDDMCFGVSAEYYGTIPDGDQFETVLNPINEDGPNKDANYAFHKDLSFENYGKSALDGSDFRYEGQYLRIENLLYIRQADTKKHNSTAFTKIYYVHEGTLLGGALYSRNEEKTSVLKGLKG